jgi:hypothetical protein
LPILSPIPCSISTTPTACLSPPSDSWQSDQEAEIVATGLQPVNDAEAAILITLAPGAYTAIESGKNGGTGLACGSLQPALTTLARLLPSVVAPVSRSKKRLYIASRF